MTLLRLATRPTPLTMYRPTGLVITVPETSSVELKRSGFLRSFKRKEVATRLRILS